MTPSPNDKLIKFTEEEINQFAWERLLLLFLLRMPSFLSESSEIKKQLDINTKEQFYLMFDQTRESYVKLRKDYIEGKKRRKIPLKVSKTIHELGEILGIYYKFYERWGRYPCFDVEQEKKVLSSGGWLSPNEWLFSQSAAAILWDTNLPVFYLPFGIDMTSTWKEIGKSLKSLLDGFQSGFRDIASSRKNFLGRIKRKSANKILEEINDILKVYDEFIDSGSRRGKRKIDLIIHGSKSNSRTESATDRRLKFAKRLSKALNLVYPSQNRSDISRDPCVHYINSLSLSNKTR